LTQEERNSRKKGLASVWQVYLTGDYERHKEVPGFPALPDQLVDRRAILAPLGGPWLSAKVTDEDLDHLQFSYPLRPKTKDLYMALKKVGLCTAGNTMDLSPEEIFRADLEAATDHPEFWKARQKPDQAPYWRFFLDGRTG
jgi:hypothetical protein